MESWSSEYLRRKDLMRTMEIPTLSEVKTLVGLPLALVVFEQCHPDLRVHFGLEPYLEGPRGELWQSPSDLLIGKVALKPPLTQKHIQALTHQGILELGAEVEQKFLNEMRNERENAIKNREEFLRRVFDAEKSKLIEEIREEERKKYEEELTKIQDHFDNKICQLLWECYEQVKQLEEQMQIEYDSLNYLWQERLDQEVQATTDRITQEFLEKLGKQEKLLVSIFRKQIDEINMTNKNAVHFERIRGNEMILQMKHKLHCQNIADLMYLLCKERRKCKNTLITMRNHYQAIIRKNKIAINKKDRTIRSLRKMNERKIKQLTVRERCLREILKQFQKFIYFALKATPTQGEFLLNINKLITFEIEDYCIREEEKRPPPKKQPIIKQEIIDVSEYLEEIQHVSPLEELEYSDALPALYFNNNVYVREDFRDMLDAGINLDPTNTLWNPDVEELINVFREKMNETRASYQVTRVKSHHSSVHFDPDKPSRSSTDVNRPSDDYSDSEKLMVVSDDSPYSGSATPVEKPLILSHPSQTSSAVFSRKSGDEPPEDREIRRVSLAAPLVIRRLSSQSGTPSASMINEKPLAFDEDPKRIKRPSVTQSRLTLARDSIILHITNIERKSLQNISKVAADQVSEAKSLETNEIAAEKIEEFLESVEVAAEGEYDDSILIPRSKIPSQGSLATQESQATSKLLLATDSVELIRRSTIGFIDKEKLKQYKDTRKSQLTFANTAEETAKAVQRRMSGPGKIPPKTAKQKSKATSQKKTTSAAVGSKPKSVAKVVGSTKMREHEKPIKQFTDERIKSLVSVMKENPSLIRLFSPCLQ